MYLTAPWFASCMYRSHTLLVVICTSASLFHAAYTSTWSFSPATNSTSMRPTTEETLDAAWNIPNFDLSQFRKTCTRTWNSVCYVTLAVLGGSHVVKPSHLLDLTNPNCELRDRLQCVILLCSVYCAVVLIYYSGVLNKVSCYTVLEESCCDALQYKATPIHNFNRYDIS